MEPNKYKKKFEDVFIKLFQPDFELNRYYAENLVRFLEDCPDKSKYLPYYKLIRDSIYHLV